jgi:hypothetical protein
MTTQSDEILRHLRAIIAANHEFRSSLPEDWESDPVNDACEEAERYLLDSAIKGEFPHLVLNLNHPAGPAYAIFRAERFVGFSFGHSAAEALDLWLDTPLSNGVMPGLAGPWSAVLEPEARQRGMIGGAP